MGTQRHDREVVFLSARRTPFGTFGGSLKDLSATDLGAHAARAALEASGQTIETGDHCFFYTATYDRHADTPEYLTSFPGLGEAACRWILDKGITTFGVDSPTPDNPVSTTYPVHLMCRHEKKTHY